MCKSVLFISIRLLLLGFVILMPFSTECQFIFNPVEKYRESITDVLEHNGNLLILQEYYLNSLDIHEIGLVTIDSDGKIISQEILNTTITHPLFARFLEIKNDTAFVVLISRNDTCSSILNFLLIDLATNICATVNSYPFCGINFYSIYKVDGIGNDVFISGMWNQVNSPSLRNYVYKITPDLHLNPILDSLVSANLSIDFSRKGYLLKDEGLTNFYDHDFNFRKQRYNQTSGVIPVRQTHRPFRENLIIESYEQKYSHDFPGFHTRLVDSNLHIKHEAFIFPQHDDKGLYYLPTFGGLDFIDENHVWVAGMFQVTGTESPEDNFFCITRLDNQMNIQCQRFLGYDAQYNFNGLKAANDNGIYIYGHVYNEKVSEYIDSYLIKLGPNCELPTVSTDESPAPIISISVYPNPSINSLTFDVKGFDPTTLLVEIFTTDGITVFSQKDLSYEIHVADLPSGQYFYRIMQKEKVLGVGGWVKE